DAALIARRGETGDIADDAAAERDEAGVAMEFGVDELVEYAAQGRERLVLLAVRQHDDARVAVAECVLQRLEIELGDDVVRHDPDLARRDGLAEKLRVAEQARADVYRVASFAERDIDRIHARSVASAGGLFKRREAFELLLQRGDDAPNLTAARIDLDIGDLLVQRAPLGREPLEHGARVLGLKKRAIPRAARAAQLLVDGGHEVDHDPGPGQACAVRRIQDSAAAGRHDDVLSGRELGEAFALAFTEASLALFLEDERNVD